MAVLLVAGLMLLSFFTNTLFADEPVRVRLFSPPPNLMKYVFLHDTQEIFSREPGWVSQEDTDLFVIFTSNLSERWFVPESLVHPFITMGANAEKLSNGNQFVTGESLGKFYGPAWKLPTEKNFLFIQMEDIDAEMNRNFTLPNLSTDEEKSLLSCVAAGVIVGAYYSRLTGEGAGAVMAACLLSVTQEK